MAAHRGSGGRRDGATSESWPPREGGRPSSAFTGVCRRLGFLSAGLCALGASALNAVPSPPKGLTPPLALCYNSIVGQGGGYALPTLLSTAKAMKGSSRQKPGLQRAGQGWKPVPWFC